MPTKCVSVRKVFRAVAVLGLLCAVTQTYRMMGDIAKYDGKLAGSILGQESVQERAMEHSRANRMVGKQNARQRRLPQCIIIGVMKCGTSALISFLDIHPDVASAPGESNYFNKYYNRTLEWYRSQMPLSRANQTTMSKTANYFEKYEVIDRIYAMDPNVKIILVVRDPVVRTVSHWLHYCRKYPLDVRNCATFESSCIFKPDGEIDTSAWYIYRSSYALHIEHWTRVFPLGAHLHVVDGAKLISDPISELRKVETFLGLRHYISGNNIVFDHERKVYCRVSRSGVKLCLDKAAKGVKHPTIDPAAEAKLRTYFKPLNQRFYQIVGHDFGWT